jgi:putative mRNA 3-end processing factor
MPAPLERHAKGYRIPGTGIHLDPLEPVMHAVISHAHGDHAAPGHEHAYCSEGTAALIRKRFTYPARHLHAIPYGEVFELNGVPFSFHPAGHILGSSQIRWEHAGKIHVYTGDFKREADPTCEAFEPVRCDVLITETTFAARDKVHPDAAGIIASIPLPEKANLMIGAYSLGKAQRITRLLNDHIPGIRVMIHPNMHDYHKVYEQMGFQLGPWEPFRRELFRQERGIAYLVPPPTLLNYRKGTHFIRAFATGWDEKHELYDFALPVSVHADWPSLIRTILESGARELYTIHGDGQELHDAEELSGLSFSFID